MKIPIRELLQKNLLYLYSALSALMMIASGYFVLYPQMLTILNSQVDRQQKIDQVAQLRQKQQILTRVDRAVMLSQLKESAYALPDEKDVATILIALENISGSTGQAIDSISFSPGLVSTDSARQPIAQGPAKESIVTKSGINALAISVQTKGTAEQFRKFLETVQASRRIFDIESVRLNYLEGAVDVVSADFGLLAYYLPPITRIGAVGQPIDAISEADRKIISDVLALPNFTIAAFSASNSATVQLGKNDLFR